MCSSVPNRMSHQSPPLRGQGMEDPKEIVSSGPCRTDAHMNAQRIHGLTPGGGPVLRGEVECSPILSPADISS